MSADPPPPFHFPAQILGCPKDSTQEEIKKIYRKGALKWHPDRWSSKTDEEKAEAEKNFKNLNRAFEVLSDPAKKKRYDSGVEEADLDNPHAGGGGHGGMSQADMMHMFMRQHMGGRGGGGGFGF